MLSSRLVLSSVFVFSSLLLLVGCSKKEAAAPPPAPPVAPPVAGAKAAPNPQAQQFIQEKESERGPGDPPR